MATQKNLGGLHIATEKDILTGLTSDIYFLRTKEILQKQKIKKVVKAEFAAKNLQYPWGIFAGLEEIMCLLKKLPLKKISGLSEGTLFRSGEPVLTLEGNYLDFGVFETAILGLMCQASGVATKAARFRKWADNRNILSFGSRRMHPMASIMIERNAFIGGCDGVSTLKAAQLLGIEPTGTMPHALILLIGDEEKTFQLFDKIVPKNVKRIALIDTFSDEKFGALKATSALRQKLYGIRLDTPSSRKGNLLEIIKEIRWELNIRKFHQVKIIVSGGLEEEDVKTLTPFVDGFGIGTAISNAPVINFSMDIVEVEGKPFTKKGKLSGEKKVVRCPQCFLSRILYVKEPLGKCVLCKQSFTLLTKNLSTYACPSAKTLQSFVLSQLSKVDI